jgi:hypothetical protein
MKELKEQREQFSNDTTTAINDLISDPEDKRVAKKIVKKYSEVNVHECKRCGRVTNTIIISDGFLACPYCQRVNALDMLSVIAKTAKGMDKVHAMISSMHQDYKYGYAVQAPSYTLLSRVTNFLFKKELKVSVPGYIKFYVNPKLLNDAASFKEKYIAVAGFTEKELIQEFFGDVAIGVKKKENATATENTGNN